MSLLDIAILLNKRHDEKVKAEEERLRQIEIHSRKLSYFQEFGCKWLEDVTLAVDELIELFNSTTGDHSKLQRLQSSNSTGDSIAVSFFGLGKQNAAEKPTCVISLHFERLKVSVEIEHVVAPCKEEYEVLVKKFSELRVQVNTVTKKQSLGDGVQWKNRETGEMEYEPTFFTKTTKGAHEFDAKEFADYALARFAENMLYK
jgi:hypothetical protein